MANDIIIFGIILSIIFYEITEISPGGLIVPAYVAFYINDPQNCYYYNCRNINFSHCKIYIRSHYYIWKKKICHVYNDKFCNKAFS